jgi:hypothetical protein
VIDPSRREERLTWVRFPSPAPPSRQAETASANSSQSFSRELRIREGQREVSRERREARREIRREVRENYYDNYYRGGDRWYRDGRYWDRYDYERRYYRGRDRDDDDLLKGAMVGAAVVGVAVAIAKSKDD